MHTGTQITCAKFRENQNSNLKLFDNTQTDRQTDRQTDTPVTDTISSAGYKAAVDLFKAEWMQFVIRIIEGH